MDRRLTREALRLMEAHEPFAWASVVRTAGSVPGKLGAAMIVRADGTSLGTVGGAELEERVKDACRRAFDERRGDLLHFDLQAWKPGGLRSLCGGTVDVAVEYVPARPNLLLWGGGHVSFAIAAILPGLDYDYCVADDRPDWVGVDRFPEAVRREVVSPRRVWDVFDPASITHLYLLGYDAMKDLELLADSIERFPGQIGLMASASKREHMFHELRERGVSRTAIGRIRSPVGIEIGAESPSEIALSIASGLVRELHPARPSSRRRSGMATRSGAPTSPEGS